MTAHLPRLSLRVDPLIGEAKQRMRRRRLLLAAVLGVVALAVGLTLALRPAGPARSGGPGAWVPQGVQEIDVLASNPPFRLRTAAPPPSLRITEPSQVSRIVVWFNALTQKPKTAPLRDGHQLVCAGRSATHVAFTFRAANGDALATAHSAPGAATYCDPIRFTVGSRPETFLLDRNHESSVIGRIEHLFGIRLQVLTYHG